MRRLSKAVRERAGGSAGRPARADVRVPGRNRLYADMAALFRRDLANVEAGIYPCPRTTTVRGRPCSSARAFSSRICPTSTAGARTAIIGRS